jgi:hypothetical protein
VLRKLVAIIPINQSINQLGAGANAAASITITATAGTGKTTMDLKRIRRAISELELIGVVVCCGHRRDPKTGELQPTYTTASSLGLMTEAEERRRFQLLAEADCRPLQ